MMARVASRSFSVSSLIAFVVRRLRAHQVVEALPHAPSRGILPPIQLTLVEFGERCFGIARDGVEPFADLAQRQTCVIHP
jgi:hypothetical protein